MVGSAVLQTATGKLGTLYIIQAFLSVRDHDSLPSLSLFPVDPNGARIHRHKHSSTQTMTLGLGWAPWTPAASRHDLQNAPMIVLDLTPPSESGIEPVMCDACVQQADYDLLFVCRTCMNIYFPEPDA
jgi:hypothetical protein